MNSSQLLRVSITLGHCHGAPSRWYVDCVLADVQIKKRNAWSVLPVFTDSLLNKSGTQTGDD